MKVSPIASARQPVAAKVSRLPQPATRTPAIRVARDAIIPAYYPGAENRCPGCTGMHWIKGRFSAECFDCGTALPFGAAGRR